MEGSARVDRPELLRSTKAERQWVARIEATSPPGVIRLVGREAAADRVLGRRNCVLPVRPARGSCRRV